jgi:hypothetical protein
VKANGGYTLRGTPPFLINGNIPVNDHDFGPGTCIATITDLTYNPAGFLRTPPMTVTATAPATVCAGAPITFTATATGGTTTDMTYTWKVGAAPAATTTANTYSPTVSAGSTYSVTVTNANGCASAAATGTITVHAVPSITTSPDAICYNTAAALSCTVSGGTTTAMTYTWEVGGATSHTTEPSITTTNLTKATTYSVTAANAYGCTSTVATGTIPVYTAFTAGSIKTANTTTIAGTAPDVTIANDVSASGGDGNITYQWRRSGTSSATLTGGAATYALSSDYTNYSTEGIYIFTRYAKDDACEQLYAPSIGQYSLNVLPIPPNSGTLTWTCGNLVWSEPLRNPVGCSAVTATNTWATTQRAYIERNEETGYYYTFSCVSVNKLTLCPQPWEVPSSSIWTYMSEHIEEPNCNVDWPPNGA